MRETSKKRILVFIDWYLPGYKAGGPVRSMANMTEHLAGMFDFYIVTRNTEYGEEMPYPSVKPDAWNDFSPGVKVWYASKGQRSLKTWRRLIRETACDVVYINGIYSPRFSLLPLVAARSMKHPKVIVAPRGMLARSAIDVKRGKKELFLKIARGAGLFRNVHWHVTNDAEAAQVKAVFGPSVIITIASNLPRKEHEEWRGIPKKRGMLKVCSIARIAPEKNTLFAVKTMQYLSDGVEVEFDLYGQIYDKAYWENCREIMSQLPDSAKLTHKGFVNPEKISDTLKWYHLLFLPSRGENFGHVILECLMAGRPVLISDQTPWRNLETPKAGWDLPLDDMQGFADAIKRLAQMDQGEYDEWCAGAWRLGQKVAADEGLVEVYREMLMGKRELKAERKKAQRGKLE